jgi:hypothetical protein
MAGAQRRRSVEHEPRSCSQSPGASVPSDPSFSISGVTGFTGLVRARASWNGLDTKKKALALFFFAQFGYRRCMEIPADQVRRFVEMANDNEALMDGTAAPVKRIIDDAADVVWGVYQDANEPYGVGL